MLKIVSEVGVQSFKQPTILQILLIKFSIYFTAFFPSVPSVALQKELAISFNLGDRLLLFFFYSYNFFLYFGTSVFCYIRT